jgi:altronate dehydratase
MAGALAPDAIEVARVQVTVVVPEQDHPVPVAETKVALAGSGSDTLTNVAAAGPALETVIV